MRIILSTFFISFPFIVRSSFNSIRIWTDFNTSFMKKSLINNDFKYPVFSFSFYLIVDILPMAVQVMLIRVVVENEIQNRKFQNKNVFKVPPSKTDTDRYTLSKWETYTDNATSWISINDDLENSFIESEDSNQEFWDDKLS